MPPLSRRRLLASAAAAAALAPLTARAAAEAQEIEWNDLIPRSGDGEDFGEMRAIMGIIEHGELSTGFTQELNAEVTTEFNGKRVRLPGFMVPLDFEGTGVTNFLLVPYVGACIHVPPPPPNQIVMVRSGTPYETEGFFEAVWVSGTFSTMALATELAEIGYVMEADRVWPYA